jgi:hypothetical protein
VTYAELYDVLKDLIHGAPVGKPAANKAAVTAVYEDLDGHEIHFSRVILGSASDYRINGKVDGHSIFWLCRMLIKFCVHVS